MKKDDFLKKRVYEFYEKNICHGKLFVAKHFITEGVSKSTVYKHIKSAELNEPLERKKGSGHPTTIATKANIKKITKMLNHTTLTHTYVAKKMKCTRQHIEYILKKYTNIKSRKKIRKPKRTAAQLKAAKPKCRKLYEKYKNFTIILDDESYFTLSNSTLAGNDRFNSDDVKKTPDNIKYKYVAKFEPKVLVWIAFSSEGVSQPLFFQSGQAINQYVYLKQCIQKRLVPFINAYHSGSSYVFWPDLASSHYAKTVIEYLNKQKINFVAKAENPANVPEARPIEDFWGDLKRAVYKNSWEAKNILHLQHRIKYCLINMDKSAMQSRASEVHRRLYSIGRYGLQ
jgi:hypothetical protein